MSNPGHIPTKPIEDRYLGDGVYASFDGHHVWLDTRAQVPVNRIALEPTVLEGLDLFRRDIFRACMDAALGPFERGEDAS